MFSCQGNFFSIHVDTFVCNGINIIQDVKVKCFYLLEIIISLLILTWLLMKYCKDSGARHAFILPISAHDVSMPLPVHSVVFSFTL